jgi:hypothetical protein
MDEMKGSMGNIGEFIRSSVAEDLDASSELLANEDALSGWREMMQAFSPETVSHVDFVSEKGRLTNEVMRSARLDGNYTAMKTRERATILIGAIENNTLNSANEKAMKTFKNMAATAVLTGRESKEDLLKAGSSYGGAVANAKAETLDQIERSPDVYSNFFLGQLAGGATTESVTNNIDGIVNNIGNAQEDIQTCTTQSGGFATDTRCYDAYDLRNWGY